jgi:hypothetical protein
MLRKTLQFIKGEKEKNPSKPEVIVDFIFDQGLFFISIKNIGDKPAFKVSIKFDKKILGVEGNKEISALPLFQNIEFLAPQKEIVTFLDNSFSYFKRGEPTKISAKILYHDASGKKHAATINHDLEIYREIGYVQRLEKKV